MAEQHAPQESEAPATGASTSSEVDLQGRRMQRTSDDFLVPGPTPTSNEGLARWGFTWLAFSLLLILMMFVITVACFGISKLIGIA
jgi:hypothetical protein